MSSPIASPFTDTQPPEWASGWGQDEYGYYAEFSVPTGDRYWEFESHRMRWIPPGRFLMGSPESEAERHDDEVPHEVTLSRGFWLGSTTVPQSLWRAVTGENPSEFEGDDRPVEQVSFEDVEGFLSSVNSRVPGLAVCLPTEAQWEYACRAGTTGPFHTVGTLTTDQANYDGNYPYVDSPKGKYREETVACGSLPPNAWGLHEMHGNVWEWCSDWYGDYASEPQTDPIGPESGSYRVVRGGSWVYFARHVRSAVRNWYGPGLRFDNLGFRCCLSSASPAEPQPSPPNGVSATSAPPRDEAASE